MLKAASAEEDNPFKLLVEIAPISALESVAMSAELRAERSREVNAPIWAVVSAVSCAVVRAATCAVLKAAILEEVRAAIWSDVRAAMMVVDMEPIRSEERALICAVVKTAIWLADNIVDASMIRS